eukprot:CAMPEP_0194208912 /NCGR_PEP_ID=MMETSP0156-20130528/7215_1 /TAXON_ID=33649 /ORGANISM="Thalassionema nitzschioides, Strain L26-B" /LENGTH=1137 /DNA_ID=CAMNT_0038935977 /DNA_START=263 /DNA_END=3676 /DNA_ORIENTATION=-
MLKGVPGTGTRKGGLEGIMLKVNLDGIVLLRFYNLCFRISIFISIVCIGIVLPINLTGYCGYKESPDEESAKCFSGFNDGSGSRPNITNYDLTTLANIPDLAKSEEILDHVFTLSRGAILGRLYGIVLCTWLISYYACKCMRNEWEIMIALRRVYYLEKDHWSERRKELENSLLLSKEDDDEEERLLLKRDPWIPHPEQRETTVNVGLYSVLVGGLPAYPEEEIDEEDIEAAVGLANRKKVDWQLEFATKYFDSCVQNPQGYSSAVAAVTILPSAFDLSNAWEKWYAAAGKLRRLRFIREVIEEKTRYDIDCDDDDDDDDDKYDDVVDDEEEEQDADDLGVLFESQDIVSSLPRENHQSFFPSFSGDGSNRDVMGSIRRKNKIDTAIYSNTDENREYYRAVLGVEDGSGFATYDFGPEQTAMYTREFSQGAANCCPTGCFTGRIRRSNIDELRQMEEDAAREVHAANILLENAQFRVMKESKKKSKEESNDFSEMTEDESLACLFANSKLRLRKKRDITSTNDDDDWMKFQSIIAESPRNEAQRNSVIDQVSSRHNNTNEKKGQSNMATEVSRRKMSIKSSGSKQRSDASNSTTQPSRKKNFQIGKDVKNVVKDSMVRESSYAVVTFMSRQAAVAARQCLADGRGQGRWVTFSDIPVPPLADAVPYNIFFCRGCCRPVSLSIHSTQKRLRFHIAMAWLFVIYVFYTLPLTFVQSLLDPAASPLPGYGEWVNSLGFAGKLIVGLLPGLCFTLFYSLCPVMFKTIANFGSNATSQFAAEYAAMKYFWWFYVVTAFWSTSLATVVLAAYEEQRITTEFIQVIRKAAGTVPTTISFSWINWIIVRATIVLPLHFLLQMNTFLFRMLGLNCCSRAVRGGGPGGAIPYRLYIDGALVFLCAATLAPAAPLLAPFATIYFYWSQPILKRNLVYVYRPNFDSGGGRWPFLFEMLITSLLVGQIMMTIMMLFKQAYGASVLAFIPFFPTYFWRQSTLATFRRAYQDASLFHTSELDGLEPHEKTSHDLRESFRRFLVDAHKAAYVPVCLARSANRESAKGSYVFTSEPACVINHDNDVHSVSPMEDCHWKTGEAAASFDVVSAPRHQYGVSLARVNRKDVVSDLRLNGDGSVTSDLFASGNRYYNA